MGTINSAFGIISGALQADQSALSVVANNVANANTTGYTEEAPTWQQNKSVTVGGVTYGDGVTQTGPTSTRDRILTERLDQQQQLASASSTRLTSLNTVQALFSPDSGASGSSAGDIGSDLTSFFDSFSSLESNPSSNSLRQGVLSSATTLASDISGAATSLLSQRASIDQEAAGITGQVNALTTSIAQLNEQIMTTSPNGDAGTLEDQREQDVSQLSQLVGINQITTQNNGLEVTTTSGVTLVSDVASNQLTSGTYDGVTHFYMGTTDITSGLTTGGGQLGGYLTVRDQDIPTVLGSLDQLAYSVSTKVNALNNSGTDLNGDNSNAGNIFSAPPYQSTGSTAGSALSMSVVMTDPNAIAAAASGEGSGDNTNATAIANLANQTIVNGTTPSDFYSGMVSALGSTISEVKAENTAQTASVTQLTTQNDALTAVNLDTEASSMTTLERSYQAATQVFTMLSQLIGSAINLGDTTTVS